MTIDLAQAIWTGVGAYLAIGVLVGLAYAFFAVARIDHAAEGASWRFRLIILPGVIGLWPIMLIRFLSFRKINAPIESNSGDAA